MAITCDRCGREMDDRWRDEKEGIGGNCPVCGNDLCAECAGICGEDGECKLCLMPLEELEYLLPLRVQRHERKEMPCPNCKEICYIAVNYKQHLWRSDSYFEKKKSRTYEISYVQEDSLSSGNYLFKTNRYHSLREAFVEAYNTLKKMGFAKKYGF